MVCESCPRLNMASLLDNEFVIDVYANTNNDSYGCAGCGEDLSEALAIEILKSLRETDTISDLNTNSDLNTIRLRAAYQSLAGHWQGVRDHTPFSILGVVALASGLNVKVRTVHAQEKEMAVTMEDLLEMVVDPNFGRSEDLHEIWAEDTGPSVGGKAPRSNPKAMVRKEEACWCCDKAMVYYQAAS